MISHVDELVLLRYDDTTKCGWRRVVVSCDFVIRL